MEIVDRKTGDPTNMKIVKKNKETPKKSLIFGKTGGHLLSVREAADFLGKTEVTISNWCKEGRLKGLPREFGTKITFLIPPEECFRVKMQLEEKKKEKLYQDNIRRKKSYNHKGLVLLWAKMCEQGLMAKGRPMSPHTIKNMTRTINKFLETHYAVEYATLKGEFINIPPEMYGKKYGIFQAVCSFYSFLIQEGYGTPEEYERIKSLRPKRFLPAKQSTISEEQLNNLIEACKDSYERALIVLLANTGLRNAELRALKLSDIDVENRRLTVKLGKGNKTRKVGLNSRSLQALETYLTDNPKLEDNYLFTHNKGKLKGMPLSAFSLIWKVESIGKRIGLEVHPHMFRRAFVTINVNKGRSLVHLQLLCGHSDMRTTRSYCMTDLDEAVKQSQEWDD
jgi:integrase